MGTKNNRTGTQAGGPGDTKTCLRCGRTIEWRKKWARSWEQVRYCSDGCRGAKLDDTDHALAAAILELLDKLAAGSTICPSQAARKVATDWEPLMERARMAARRLQSAGACVILQKGVRVDPSTARGPIRIGRP